MKGVATVRVYKSKGQMFPWVTHQCNPVAGQCPYQCSYCYMEEMKRRFELIRERYSGDLRFDDRDVYQSKLGRGRTIFVQSAGDLCAAQVPNIWIHRVLQVCEWEDSENNEFLFLTKNPRRYLSHLFEFPVRHGGNKYILGATIETNRSDIYAGISLAPGLPHRLTAMESLRHKQYMGPAKRVISIEPVMDFDLDVFVRWMGRAMPHFISIGADTCRSGLPEPGPEKLEEFIRKCRKFTEVRLKKNLRRILGDKRMARLEEANG